MENTEREHVRRLNERIKQIVGSDATLAEMKNVEALLRKRLGKAENQSPEKQYKLNMTLNTLLKAIAAHPDNKEEIQYVDVGLKPPAVEKETRRVNASNPDAKPSPNKKASNREKDNQTEKAGINKEQFEKRQEKKLAEKSGESVLEKIEKSERKKIPMTELKELALLLKEERDSCKNKSFEMQQRYALAQAKLLNALRGT